MENEIDPALVAATSSLGAFHFPVAEAAEWDHHKPRIAELYEKKELKEVMQILKDEHGFTASESQYKKQLAKWGLNKKNVKSGEYKAMIRKQRDRAKDGKDTEFYIHGNKVPAVNIARFEERWRKKEGLGEGDAFDDVPTPKSLTFRTPSPEI
ncbi:hypothetical protein K491DRAFT_669339 [Lophiostoma macrostomum CBS 122681]|uniref:Clr5 domain-containing protein n=1 Tax=Lophiostoma macrostomum CBS 122681 TaxID=1314788 RepID=A0A6A6SQG8_9PLEO|nr:hypothetical protein K491DRAFT_669339 [Lophiostoma macrostomum CBS 122681]